MWYRFEKGEPKGKLRAEHVQVVWYDMERNGSCFDESFLKAETFQDLGKALTYVETAEDEGHCDRSRVFVYMDNGDCYELQMRKLSKEQQRECCNFYGGK